MNRFLNKNSVSSSELDITLDNKIGTVGLIAAAFSGGQPKNGVEEAPQLIMDAGLIDQLHGLGWNVEFEGRVRGYTSMKPESDPPFGKVKNPRFVGKVCKHVAKQVEDFQRDGKLALTLGGDHSLGLATIAGTVRAWRGRKDVCVIWIDAHADINTPESTGSGNIHGMPLSWILGLVNQDIEGFEWLKDEMPFLSPDRLVYIGLRDLDQGEKTILKENNIKAFSMHEVDRYGIGEVVEMALRHVNPNLDRPIHLSFDVDALDPSVAPSTGTPVRGGLTFREGHFICERIHETGLMVAMDLTEVNPTLGDEAQRVQTVQIGCSLIRSALGETLL